jgi:hypothetical protein
MRVISHHRSLKENPRSNHGPIHSAYNSFFSAYFFSQNSVLLSQQISQQCFSAGLSAQSSYSFSPLALDSVSSP